MSNFKKLFLLPSLAFAFTIQAQIYEIETIEQVQNYLKHDQKQLVAFDIDNTLLCPEQDLGSDQWFSYLLKQKLQAGLNINDAVNQILPTYLHIQNHISLIPTEADLAQKIKVIETICNHTICLTARSLKLIPNTLKQLKLNQLNFCVPEINHACLELPCESHYEEGVLFCSNNCKGSVLIKFLQACHYKPELIILVDDKLHNLQSVAKQLNNCNINFIGLRYTGCDQRVARFDAEATNLALIKFLEQHPIN
jgi:hypothetical protein